MKKRQHWIIEGIFFGIIMLVFSSLFDFLNHDFIWRNFPKRIIIWLIGGLLYGFIMHLANKKYLNKIKENERNNN
ncbi:hypothetical protein CLV86_2805 [Lacinutrix venerupis]|uniref:hypothetical protein n=1 Tax=Lacinutrix venerupis TaxID=1486034 RepID=UPI000EAE78CA|nr:hypothetical protein [Lacinutrix venerupis]RLJ60955.1 hypothetical protein CLV86_2805 [Lacinutrix venerupis]